MTAAKPAREVTRYTSPYMVAWHADNNLSHEQFVAKSAPAHAANYDVELEAKRLFVLPWRKSRPSHAAIKAWTTACPTSIEVTDEQYTGAVPLGMLGPLLVLGHCDADFPFAKQVNPDVTIPVVLSGADYKGALLSIRTLDDFIRSLQGETAVIPPLNDEVQRITGGTSRKDKRFSQAMAKWLSQLPWVSVQDKNSLAPYIKAPSPLDAIPYPLCTVGRYLSGESPLASPHEIIGAKAPDAGILNRRHCEKRGILPIRLGERHVVLLCGQGERLGVRDQITSLGIDDIVFVETNGDFITNTLQGNNSTEVVTIDQSTSQVSNTDELVIDPTRLRNFQPNSVEPDPNLLFEWIISEAMRYKSSDIHVDEYANKLRVRLAVDNGGFELNTFPRHLINALSTVIKNRSDMRGDGYSPQDKRFSFRYLNRMVDVRASLLYSQGKRPKFTLRLLDKSIGIKNLSQLGLSDRDLEELRSVIAIRYGLILLSGPTGSGKSSTLYACLSELNTPQKFIYTLEDPPEYEIEGVTQIACTAGRPTDTVLTFADTLSKVLRADPDVVMVGEIRDQATAKTAVDAALTGHLLLGTVHANDSGTVLTRLFEFGVERMNASEAMLLSSSQRLVRKVCSNCAAHVPMDDHLRKVFVDAGVPVPDGHRHIFKVGDDGCEECNKTGYKGRALVLEFLRFNDEMRSMVHKNASMQDLRTYATKNVGYRTLYQKGLELVLGGITTLDEVTNVCRR